MLHRLLPVAEAKDGGALGRRGRGLGSSEERRGGAREIRAGKKAGVGAGLGAVSDCAVTGAVMVLGQRLCSWIFSSGLFSAHADTETRRTPKAGRDQLGLACKGGGAAHRPPSG